MKLIFYTIKKIIENMNKWFLTKVGVAPVYSKPSFKSEYLTELVLGENCSVTSETENWLFIVTEDGYEGYINKFYGKISSKKRVSTFCVSSPNSEGFFSNQYPFGSMVKNEIIGASKIKNDFDKKLVIPIAKQLIGIPYKWGGKSSLGFDCSGLVHSVFKVCGMKIPRDSAPQLDYFRNKKISMSDAKPGDLHFFGKEETVTHVGFSLGGSGILHAYGYVKEEDIKTNNLLSEIYLQSCSI